MKRVMIIGSPGTGKSWFARGLAGKTGLPLIHLDFYYHDQSQNYYDDKPAWQARVEELTAGNSWIIDGNYGKTMAERMQRADTIFFFDLPRRTALWGVTKRRISAHKTRRPDMPPGWKENAGPRFYKTVWSFRKKYGAGTRELFAQNNNKQIVVFTSRRQADDYLKTLDAKHLGL